MNSPWNSARAGGYGVAVLVIASLACRSEKPTPAPPGTPPPAGQRDTVTQAQQDARFLGKEVLNVLDQVLSYRTSHRGRMPKSLREVGLDTLTSATIRRLTPENDQPYITVRFRSTAGRQVRSCRGGRDALDESTLSGGAFTLDCVLIDGTTTSIHVPPPPSSR